MLLSNFALVGILAFNYGGGTATAVVLPLATDEITGTRWADVTGTALDDVTGTAWQEVS